MKGNGKSNHLASLPLHSSNIIPSVIFFSTLGHDTSRDPSHFRNDARRKVASPQLVAQTLRPFFRFSFGSYSSIMTVACESVASPFFREVIATGVNPLETA